MCPVRDGRVLCLDARDGREIWQVLISGKSPVLTGCAWADHFVFAATRDGVLGVIDADSGKLIEPIALNDDSKPGHDGLCLSSPTVAGGCLYIGSETGGLRCFAGARGNP